MKENREDGILQVAEEMVRQGGYNSFSFRQIADKVGIKSASVHYHFPTKEDLGVAVAKRYTEKFIEAIGQPDEIYASGGDPVKSYISAFRSALIEDKGMCLCGVLGAETDVLPELVIAETQMFFTRNVEWLERAYQCLGYDGDTRDKAIQTVSLLEGAMLMSNIMNDKTFFDSAAQLLR